MGGAAKQPQDGSCRIADIADTARLCCVLFVAEVADKGGHAAFTRCCEAQDFFELLGAMLGLNGVGLFPAGGAKGDVAGEVDAGAAMDFELLESLVEFLFGQFRSCAQIVDGCSIFAKHAEDLVEMVCRRVVAIEEKVRGCAGRRRSA